VRKLKSGVDFFIHEGLNVENNPLEVNNEDVGEIREQSSFGDIDFFFAFFAHVFRDGVLDDIFFKRFVESFAIFDREGEIIENVFIFFDIVAIGASDLRNGFASVDAFQNGAEGSGFESAFKAIEDHANEFLGVLLNSNIDRIALEVFEGEAEFSRREVLPVTEGKEDEEFLQLMEDIIINFQILIFGNFGRQLIFCHEHREAELFAEEKLLKHSNHIANAAEVSNPQIIIEGLGISKWREGSFGSWSNGN